LNAQAVKKVIAEHFTNTYCSVCASRNPGFYNNLWKYPQVLHIAYHPSSPYIACPLSQHNKPENDDRTNFYGVYGSTPRIVIQGSVIPSSANYTDTNLFVSQLGQTTPFEVKVSLEQVSVTTLAVKAVVKKVAASTLTALDIYGALTEDTLFFTASNGETKHYDVFRKAVWGSNPISIAVPAAVGDSTVSTQTITINSEWSLSRLHATVILQDAAKAVVQAERSGNVGGNLGMPMATQTISLYPNPAKNALFLTGVQGKYTNAIITNISGKALLNLPAADTINISSLSSGLYFLSLAGGNDTRVIKFIKE
jgi:hypothetical protein